jgi:hypothetical protein
LKSLNSAIIKDFHERMVGAGLPEGKYSNQKSQFGQILESLAMKDVGPFSGHFVYFTAISYIL